MANLFYQAYKGLEIFWTTVQATFCKNLECHENSAGAAEIMWDTLMT